MSVRKKQDSVVVPSGQLTPPPWGRTPAAYLAGKTALDGADLALREVEKKWGCGRLQLMVSPELGAKFEQQRIKLDQALWRGELVDLQREAERMRTACRVLDQAAESAGAVRLSAKVLEVRLSDGSVAALTDDPAAVQLDGREVRIFGLEEIARLLEPIAAVKKVFPGATVHAVREISDTMLAFRDSDFEMDGRMPDGSGNMMAG